MKPEARDILIRIENREDLGEDSFAAHEAWIRSARGQQEAAVLVKEFKSLTPKVRAAVATIAARTGCVEAVPLTIAGLNDRVRGKEVVEAVLYAARMGAKEPFRKAVAPHVLPWLAKEQRMVVTALPRLDEELAAEALLTTDFLKGDPVLTTEVMQAFNEAGRKVPVNIAEASLALHRPAMQKSRGGGPSYLAWKEALFALACHKPDEAVTIAEKVASRWRGREDSLSDVYLHASGLMNLYDRLCDAADDPRVFARLPEPAKIYFATTYFLSDWENGGLTQAFGNNTGDFAGSAKQGFEVIGAKRHMAMLNEARSWFGAEGPSPDRTRREQQMEEMEPSFFDREEQLNEASPENREEAPSPWWLLKRWAARNADVLRPFA